jgi:hypothetical protein
MSEAMRPWVLGAIGRSWLCMFLGFLGKKQSALRTKAGLSARMKAESETAAAGHHPSEVLSLATINCRSTGPDKHVILVTYSKVITYRPRRVAALDGA